MVTSLSVNSHTSIQCADQGGAMLTFGFTYVRVDNIRDGSWLCVWGCIDATTETGQCIKQNDS